jgi:hypothetical protein
VRREERRRLAPRLERVLWRLGGDLRSMVGTVFYDYAQTHARTFKRPPADVLGALDHWLAEQGNEDSPRQKDERWRFPLLIHQAIESSLDVKRDVAPDREILEPDLVRASDDFGWHVGHCATIYSHIEQGLSSDPVDSEHVAVRAVVKATRDFAKVFLRYGDPGWAKVPDLTIEAAEETSRHQLRKLEQPDEEW